MPSKLQRIPPIVPVAGDIYRGDVLDRRPSCEHLRDAILAAKTPCVLAVDGSWGTGKTVFLQMLQEECKAHGMPCVYFDAWKADFHEDALAAMIGGIEMQMEARRSIPALIRIGRKLCEKTSWLPAAGATLAVTGQVAGDTATGGVATMGGAAAKGVHAVFKKANAVTGYVSRQKAMNEFRSELEKFANLEGSESKPLVFFVDELDRCRPLFAVEVLEKIKHVFDVPGVFFVVAVNKMQLQKTILSVYGDIQSGIYLRRFFDFEFVLTNPADIIMSALERCRVKTSHILDGDDLCYFLPLMCWEFGVSLRDQEQIAALVTNALASTPEREPFYSVYMAFFVVLKFANPELYKQSLACVQNGERAPFATFEDFPFERILEYYDKTTGAVRGLDDSSGTHNPHRNVIQALRVAHYLNQKGYAESVEKPPNRRERKEQ